MRSKAPLALMEQAVMVLVFALAAALCLRVFVWSDRTAARGEARDRAVIEAQNAAEIIKSEGARGAGTAELFDAAARALGVTNASRGAEPMLAVPYNADWSFSEDMDTAEYILFAQPLESVLPGLASAHVYVTWGEDILFELDVAWQTEVER